MQHKRRSLPLAHGCTHFRSCASQRSTAASLEAQVASQAAAQAAAQERHPSRLSAQPLPWTAVCRVGGILDAVPSTYILCFCRPKRYQSRSLAHIFVVRSCTTTYMYCCAGAWSLERARATAGARPSSQYRVVLYCKGTSGNSTVCAHGKNIPCSQSRGAARNKSQLFNNVKAYSRVRVR